MTKINYDNIPESLRQRRGERAIITVWFAILPLLIGSLGIYNYYTKEEQFFIGKPEIVFYKEKCGGDIIQNNCLFFVINKDTIRALLSDSDTEKYLNLASFSNNNLKKELENIPKYDKSRIKYTKQRDKIKKLYKVQNHIYKVELEYVNQIVKSLRVNDVQIILYKSALLWGIIFVSIGFLWIAVHLHFFIKDPYNVYKNKKEKL